MIIDFGWDWEKYEQGGVKYRRRGEFGRLVVHRWQTSDGYTGRWVPVEATDDHRQLVADVKSCNHS